LAIFRLDIRVAARRSNVLDCSASEGLIPGHVGAHLVCRSVVRDSFILFVGEEGLRSGRLREVRYGVVTQARNPIGVKEGVSVLRARSAQHVADQ
jgi:hypothetical protein